MMPPSNHSIEPVAVATGFFEPAPGPVPDGTALVGAARAAALRGLIALQRDLDRPVRSGMLRSFAQWLGWPEWLYRGTGLAGHQGALPVTITLSDDVLLLANIVDAGHLPALAGRLAEMSWPVVSSADMLLMLGAPDLASTFGIMADAASAGIPHVCYCYRTGPHGRAAFEVDHPVEMGPVSDATALVALIVAAKLAQIYAGPRMVEACLHLRSSHTATVGVIERSFGCSVVTEAAQDRFEFPASWAQIPNAQHDPVEWRAMLAAHRDRMQRAKEIDVVGRIRQIVCDHLARDRRVPRLKEVAGREGVSNRTMVRMLASAKTSFHAIVDEERKRLTADLIRRESLSLAEVASAIGFTDMSTFGRSFRAWFGTPPGRYRRSLIAPADTSRAA